MSSLEALHNYYSGQRFVALAGAIVAILYLLIARAAYVRTTYPARSFAITVFFIAGIFMLPANTIYFFYIGPQSAGISSVLARSESEFHASEETHLNSMMHEFKHNYRLDSAMVLVGLLAVAVGFGVKSDKLIGVGLAVALCATTLLAGEVWSKQRAFHYREALLAARDDGYRTEFTQTLLGPQDRHISATRKVSPREQRSAFKLGQQHRDVSRMSMRQG